MRSRATKITSMLSVSVSNVISLPSQNCKAYRFSTWCRQCGGLTSFTFPFCPLGGLRVDNCSVSLIIACEPLKAPMHVAPNSQPVPPSFGTGSPNALPFDQLHLPFRSRKTPPMPARSPSLAYAKTCVLYGDTHSVYLAACKLTAIKKRSLVLHGPYGVTMYATELRFKSETCGQAFYMYGVACFWISPRDISRTKKSCESIRSR